MSNNSGESGDYPMSSFWKNDMRKSGRKGAAARTAAFSARDECKYGHKWTPENTGWKESRGKRVRFCLKCYEDRKATARIGERVQPKLPG